MSSLLQALYRGDRATVDELLAADPSLDVFEAAALGRTEGLRELLDEDPARANAFGDDGFHPLGLACFFGHVDAARLLLERGADVNALSTNEHVQTAAIHAGRCGGEGRGDALRARAARAGARCRSEPPTGRRLHRDRRGAPERRRHASSSCCSITAPGPSGPPPRRPAASSTWRRCSSVNGTSASSRRTSEGSSFSTAASRCSRVGVGCWSWRRSQRRRLTCRRAAHAGSVTASCSPSSATEPPIRADDPHPDRGAEVPQLRPQQDRARRSGHGRDRQRRTVDAQLDLLEPAVPKRCLRQRGDSALRRVDVDPHVSAPVPDDDHALLSELRGRARARARGSRSAGRLGS